MRQLRLTTRALGAVVTGALLCCACARASAQEAAAAGTPAPAPAEPTAVISNLDFEGAAFLSVTFAELAVPDEGSLNPVGAGGYLALRYVPATFPFHAYFESGGSLFATGSTTGPSGTDYDNRLSAWFFSPGVGLDAWRFRFTAGVGPSLVMTRHFSSAADTSSLGFAIASNVGVAYRFFEKSTWASSVELRYQTVPGAKINALSLGLRLRFASITYR